MQEFRKSYSSIKPDILCLPDVRAESVLFFDIETTGLSKERTNLYLIGAGYFSEGAFNLIQWFADNPSEENYILDDFLAFSEGFETLIHFNGNRFDMPYIDYKAGIYGYENSLDSLKSIDIYTLVKPFKKLLGLQSLKQRDIEMFLGVNREDPYSGRDLISVYYDQVRDPDEEKLRALLKHNEEDILNLAGILPVTAYFALKDAELFFDDIKKNEYTDYHGNDCIELIFIYHTSLSLKASFNSFNEGVFFSYDNGEIKIRIPIKEMTLKHFFPDYKNYYYLPMENMCIHKSVASGVDRRRRERAKKENCYIKKSGLFMPVFELEPGNHTLFKDDYRSKMNHIEYDDGILTDKKMQDLLGPALIAHLIGQ
ncbi:MAG: ribonuclease H-like domain-containing protein [Lachnospiraceae bacterium]|nr:ribonuclease H-like domain-containing protein [Lachnospiraceae bacterium]